MVSAISFGWFADFGKSLTTNQSVFIPTGSFRQMVSTLYVTAFSQTELFEDSLFQESVHNMMRKNSDVRN